MRIISYNFENIIKRDNHSYHIINLTICHVTLSTQGLHLKQVCWWGKESHWSQEVQARTVTQALVMVITSHFRHVIKSAHTTGSAVRGVRQSAGVSLPSLMPINNRHQKRTPAMPSRKSISCSAECSQRPYIIETVHSFTMPMLCLSGLHLSLLTGGTVVFGHS